MNGEQELPQPSERRQVIAQQTTTTVTFAGPIPPPNILEQYDRIVPGAAERIIRMAEEQSLHRRQLETKVIDSGVSNSKLGLWFGLIIGSLVLVAVVILAIHGYPIPATILGGGFLVSLVSVFVFGSQARQVERAERKRLTTK